MPRNNKTKAQWLSAVDFPTLRKSVVHLVGMGAWLLISLGEAHFGVGSLSLYFAFLN